MQKKLKYDNNIYSPQKLRDSEQGVAQGNFWWDGTSSSHLPPWPVPEIMNM